MLSQKNDNENTKTAIKKEIKELDGKLKKLDVQINDITELQSKYLNQKRLKITDLMKKIKETSDITRFIGKWFIKRNPETAQTHPAHLDHQIFFVCNAIDDQKGLVGIQYSFYAQYEYKELDVALKTLEIQYLDEYDNYRVINDQNEEYQLGKDFIPPELINLLKPLLKPLHIKFEDDI